MSLFDRRPGADSADTSTAASKLRTVLHDAEEAVSQGLQRVRQAVEGEAPSPRVAARPEGAPAALARTFGSLEDVDHDPGKLAKKLGLGKVEWNYDDIAPVAMLEGIPWGALPKLDWILKVGVRAIQILANERAVHEQAGGPALDAPAADAHTVLRLAAEAAGKTDAQVEAELRAELEKLELTDLPAWFEGLLSHLKDAHPTLGGEAGLKQYEALFQLIRLPDIAHTFEQDASFANLRVAGPNPTSLQRVEGALPTKFPVTEAQYQGVMGAGDSLSQAISEGRLYLLDYAGLEPIVNGTYPSAQKYTYEPLALFAVPAGRYSPRALVPVAIQCGQDPGSYEVITPDRGDTWLTAKTVVTVADGNFHELVAHLGRTHLVVEPFPVAMELHLSEGHPLRTLLAPHLEGTLFINWAAGAFLVAPKNFVDALLSGTIDADRAASVKGTASRGFNASFLPRWLESQGLHDADLLPVYPFRDDALLLWDAIGAWAAAYVAVYWADDDAVQADTELQAFATGLAAFDGGRVGDFGETPDGAILTTAYLAQMITMVIFTGSAMHAAVNFPQGDIMDYAPAFPLAGYRPAPTTGQTVSHAEWLATLPDVDQAMTQLKILFLLGSVYYTRLGAYPDGTFTDEAVLAALTSFQNRLDEIEQIIDNRNLSRTPAYEYLLPSKIPQSINI